MICKFNEHQEKLFSEIYNMDCEITKNTMEIRFFERICISWVCSFRVFLVFTFLENYFCLLGVGVSATKCFEQGDFLMEHRGKTRNKSFVCNVKECNLFIANKSQIQDIFVYLYLCFFSAWVVPSGKMKRISDHILL